MDCSYVDWLIEKGNMIREETFELLDDHWDRCYLCDHGYWCSEMNALIEYDDMMFDHIHQLIYKHQDECCYC